MNYNTICMEIIDEKEKAAGGTGHVVTVESDDWDEILAASKLFADNGYTIRVSTFDKDV